MGKKDIVELEMGEDGTYTPKTAKVKEKKSKKHENSYGHNSTYGRKLAHGESSYVQAKKPTVFKESHADDFLSGVDAGLDFIEKVVPRVERFLRLRG